MRPTIYYIIEDQGQTREHVAVSHNVGGWHYFKVAAAVSAVSPMAACNQSVAYSMFTF